MPRRKLCSDCRFILADWLKGNASDVEDGGGEPEDTLIVVCSRDGRRTFKLGEVRDGQ